MPMLCTWIMARLISACIGPSHPFYKMSYRRWEAGASPLCRAFEFNFWMVLIAAAVGYHVLTR